MLVLSLPSTILLEGGGDRLVSPLPQPVGRAGPQCPHHKEGQCWPRPLESLPLGLCGSDGLEKTELRWSELFSQEGQGGTVLTPGLPKRSVEQLPSPTLSRLGKLA